MLKRDFAGGLTLLAFAGVYALAASNLSMTSSLGIGSGLFPMMLAGLLVLFGVAMTVQALRADPSSEEEEHPGEAGGPVPLRGILLVAAAPLIFALIVVPLGLAPALGVSVFAAALANRTTTLVGALGVSLAMVLFCLALFRWMLGLPLQMFGPLLAF
ncbi:tripartite tricarboxylate transporter TctB family protein [Chelativorans sp. Marseille-P2723]|uniref:tripartite tricarboxylate transporter TctB family protein n=1 Tax=Chelativorans sp. Marseille-P2723 TaxID=2709133 RepID=UPI0015713CC9|nr:tripartite tricarboxylate transporter TctB family protein [Chelativorans sp. Marseille-P2723]